MKTMTELQKAILKNVLKNFRKGMNAWIDGEKSILPDKITVFFEEKTGMNFSKIEPLSDRAIDISVEIDMYIDRLISDVERDGIRSENVQDIAFMLECQGWMPKSLDEEVIRLADLPFPIYTEKNLML